MKAQGEVYLVGAGPGAADLITLRGLRLLQRADVVLHDRLISSDLLSEVRTGAEIIDVGKTPGRAGAAQEQVNALLVAKAKTGAVVVRLKGGDPGVFGRAAEEMAACRAAGIPCRVVPGVSSALAAPAALGISLTVRGMAQSVAICTARSAAGSVLNEAAIRAAAAADTVVVLMGGAAVSEVMAALRGAGRSGDTPAACIASATLPQERTVVATVDSLAQAAADAALAAPMVIVVGKAIDAAAQDLGMDMSGNRVETLPP